MLAVKINRLTKCSLRLARHLCSSIALVSCMSSFLSGINKNFWLFYHTKKLLMLRDLVFVINYNIVLNVFRLIFFTL